MIEIARFLITTNPGFYDKDCVDLLEGSFKCIRTIDNASISLLSRRPDFDKDRYNVRVVGINIMDFNKVERVIHKLSFPQYFLLALFYKATGKYVSSDRFVVENRMWKEYCESDVIITGLDDSFTTIYGTMQFYLNFYEIMLWKLLNKKVVLYGGSLGPFKGKRFEILARYILGKPDLITMGEELSYNYVKKIGVRNLNMHVTADLTFPINVAPYDRITEIMKIEGIGDDQKPLIGVSFNRVILKQALLDAPDNLEKYKKFVKVIADVLDDLTEKTGATIVFLPHVFGPCDYFDDRITLSYFRSEMKNKEKAIIIKNEYSPGELRGLTGKCDFFIGSRTQALISSAIMRVPFIALDYESFATMGIIGKMLKCEDFIVNVKELDRDQLLKKVQDSWARRDSIKVELRQKTAGMKERALLNAELLMDLVDQ